MGNPGGQSLFDKRLRWHFVSRMNDYGFNFIIHILRMFAKIMSKFSTKSRHLVSW